MPIFVFGLDRISIVFLSAFEADMHEGKFNPDYWLRYQYLIERDEDGSERGNAFVTFRKPLMEAFWDVYYLFYP